MTNYKRPPEPTRLDWIRFEHRIIPPPNLAKMSKINLYRDICHLLCIIDKLEEELNQIKRKKEEEKKAFSDIDWIRYQYWNISDEEIEKIPCAQMLDAILALLKEIDDLEREIHWMKTKDFIFFG